MLAVGTETVRKQVQQRTCMRTAAIASPEATMGASTRGTRVARTTVRAVIMGMCIAGWPIAAARQ